QACPVERLTRAGTVFLDAASLGEKEVAVVIRAELAARKSAVMRNAARRYQGSVIHIMATAERVARFGPLGAATPAQRSRFVAREIAKHPGRFEGLGFERMIGPALELEPRAPTAAALEAGKPVARIVELLDRRQIGEGFATGFLVTPGLLVTNWHVFGRPGEAVGCGAHFGYQRNDAGVVE